VASPQAPSSEVIEHDSAARRGWTLRRRWALAAVVVLAVTTAVAFGLGRGRPMAPLSSARPGFDPQIGVSVFLCVRSSRNPSCGHANATRKQKDDIVTRLRTATAVREVRYESQQQAVDTFRNSPQNLPGKANVRAADLPDSYRLYLRSPSAAAAITTLAASLGGVDAAVDRIHHRKVPHGPQIGVSVFFCISGTFSPLCHRSAAIEAQKQAVLARIHSLPEVAQVQYQSADQALINFRLEFGEADSNGVSQGDLPDSYRLYLRSPSDASTVVRALTGLPGVEQVVDNTTKGP
jgi:cell division protein FtsX